jgi:hypothetical protein
MRLNSNLTYIKNALHLIIIVSVVGLLLYKSCTDKINEPQLLNDFIDASRGEIKEIYIVAGYEDTVSLYFINDKKKIDEYQNIIQQSYIPKTRLNQYDRDWLIMTIKNDGTIYSYMAMTDPYYYEAKSDTCEIEILDNTTVSVQDSFQRAKTKSGKVNPIWEIYDENKNGHMVHVKNDIIPALLMHIVSDPKYFVDSYVVTDR